MNYKLCPLFGLQSKKMLKRLLGMSNSKYFNVSYFSKCIIPFIDKTNEKKPRLIEAPNNDLKRIQSNLLTYLKKLDVPYYVFSGIEKKSYIDNGKIHKGCRFLYKIDISKFFPSISRDKIYKFFNNNMAMSPDVANIISNICSINYKYFSNHRNFNEVQEFMRNTGIKKQAHLMTGAPISPLLSYLANIQMFDKLYEHCVSENIYMSIYVDDMVFSSKHKFNPNTIKFINSTIKKHGYKLSTKKCQYYMPYMAKKITGVIINKHGEISTPNSLIYKTHKRIDTYKADNQNELNFNSLRGCVLAANSIDGRFSSLKNVLLIKKLKR